MRARVYNGGVGQSPQPGIQPPEVEPWSEGQAKPPWNWKTQDCARRRTAPQRIRCERALR